MTAPTQALKIYIIAGEPSGDLLGARVMAALKAELGGNVIFYGVGGDCMRREGLESLFPMEELSIMGLVEVLPHIPKLIGRIALTVRDVLQHRPAVVVTIDSPAFTFRVARKLKGKGIPLIHYVAPSVWAWKPWRARKIARIFDHLLALLPIEPRYFESEGLPTTFVGHSVIESGADKGDGVRFRAKHNLPLNAPLLCLLPGSRRGEIHRLLPIFKDCLIRLSENIPGLRVVLPTMPHLSDELSIRTANWPILPTIVVGKDEKFDAFKAADAALAASGTVSLELAMAGTPTLITYQMNPLTFWIVEKMVRVKHVSLVNILLEKEVVPELLQDDCRIDDIVNGVRALLTDKGCRMQQGEGFVEALALLGYDQKIRPSIRAARTILAVIRKQSPE